MVLSPVAASSSVLEELTTVRVRMSAETGEDTPECTAPPDVREEKEGRPHAPYWRWMMLGILSLDICVSYIPYYTFVPILRQSTQVYSVDENALNVLCILYALVYVPGAFLTGPVVGTLGCRWTFALAMGLTTIGAALRCGPPLLKELLPVLAHVVDFSRTSADVMGRLRPEIVLAPSAPSSFAWVVLGQALCALGQPFLVNSTSEMGAEWFPPHERPTAALISNLMNFVGGSLSFVIPPLVVEEQDHLDVAERQLARLLRLQLAICACGFLVTLLLYQPAPRLRGGLLAKREQVTFFSEVRGVLALRDFWLINGYFTVYVALCHAFDAVEGSLLERYGYSAALSSWTGVSCGVASVLISLVESWCIADASAYRPTLVVSSAAMAISFLIAFACLHFQMHGSVFVVAIGFMGLSVPAWGCSCELGSEVCFPAREATVSSILEAFSNLMGVVSIIGIQHMLDKGCGASVLLVMAFSSLAGAGLLWGTSGRLRRTEAEAAAEAEREAELEGVVESQNGSVATGSATPPVTPNRAKAAGSWLPLPSRLRCLRSAVLDLLSPRSRLRRALLWFLSIILLYRCLLVIPQSQLPEEFAESLSEAPVQPELLRSRNRGAGGRDDKTGLLRNGMPEPRNFVIHCPWDQKRLTRFSRHMEEAGVSFAVVPCVTGTYQEVAAAVREGLLPNRALKATRGWSRHGQRRSEMIGLAIAHLRALKVVANSSVEQPMVANIFEDTEVVHPNFRTRRNQLLELLPQDMDLVKLSVLRPAGMRLIVGNSSEWMYRKIFRMRPRTSPLNNLWLSNYVVTRRGAQRILQIGRKYDTFGTREIFDVFVLAHLYSLHKAHGFHGFAVESELLSTHCGAVRLCADARDRAWGQQPVLLAYCRHNASADPRCRED